MFFPVEKESPLQKDIKNNILELYGWDDGAHSFLRRGKEKVSAEMALTFLTYILCRFLNLLGTGVLVAYFNKRKQEKQGMKGPCFLTFGQFISKMGNKKVRKL